VLAFAGAHAPCLIGVFQSSSLEVVFLNDTGRQWLNPQARASLTTFTLPEIVGVRSVDALQNEWVPRAKVLGRWTGELDLRDVWGGEMTVRAALLHRPARATAGHDYLYFLAERSRAAGDGANSDREFLRALLETVPDAIYFKDRHSRFLRVSRALARKDGTSDAAAFIGRTDFDRFTVEHARLAYEDEQKIIRTGEPVLDLEEKETWADGRVTWASTSKFPLRDDEGRIVGTFGISRDITERKREETARREMEAQLHLAQKLESIGRLAAGIAHEINTPTQFITDNMRFLLESFAQIATVMNSFRALRLAAEREPNLASAVAATVAAEKAAEIDYLETEIPQTLQQSLDGLGRIARIVRSLKEFSHPSSPKLAPTDINRAIETAITVSRHEWKYVADLVTELDPELPLVPCLVDAFGQAVLNLIINAAHAIESAGKVQPGRDLPKRGVITVRTRSDGQWAYVEIADTGTGIPVAIRSQIFEPFFTTKQVGKGTGQGLAIVRNVVVHDHHGAVEFDSEEGKGTTFRLKLPLTMPEPAPAPATTQPTQTSPSP
jgi:PAS domain S-box-containing protein